MSNTTPASTPEKERRGLPWWIVILIALAVALCVRVFVAEPYIVPTGSMLDTIQLGDRLIGEKVSYRFRDPAVGDVVTFADPETPSTTLIKRVIATGGQTVDLQNGQVVVDGKVLDEPYTEGKPTYPLDQYATILSAPVTYPYTVPEGYVWVMGDNRTNSADSRYFGPVSVSAITSHGWLIYWPVSDIGLL